MPADLANPAASAVSDTASGDVSALSYEQARDELVTVVNRLEQGTATLEESLALWERGESLARRCEEWLIGAKARLDAARAGVERGAGILADDDTGSDPRGDVA